MSPVVRISDPIFQRLQAVATPLVDTPASVIEKLLDYYEESHIELKSFRNKAPRIDDGVVKLDPDSPESLSHTRVRYACINDNEISHPNWNKLLQQAHKVAWDQVDSYKDLKSVTISNIINGKLEERGFKFIPELNISIQGESADEAWKKTLYIAKKLNLSVEVKFEWHNKESAAYPGKQGVLSWNPK